tara:strand:+ start:13778 stop:14602 length:825 start_codon:yes stop_codon:yes gene_type:complete
VKYFNGGKMHVAFVGGGVMAEAMLSQAIASGICLAKDIQVSELIEARVDYLKNQYGVRAGSIAIDLNNFDGLVVIAVKPQQITQVYSELGGRFNENHTAVSIAAGITLKSLVNGLGHDRIVRVMPNTPAQIGQGMSVWTATKPVPFKDIEDIKILLSTLGREWFVNEEEYIDKATAISGSGPAYVFAFIESLINAAIAIGMPLDMAEVLVKETVAGSSNLAKLSEHSPSKLREMVTSPGGTTAAALPELSNGGLNEIVSKAAAAALNRAKELGG